MSTDQMLALRVTGGVGPEPSLEPIAKPIAPHGSVLVKIRAAAINPSDFLNAQGSFDHRKSTVTLGRDYSGVVEAGPADLIGMEVYGTSGNSLSFTEDGTHAEYCIVPQDCLARKPSNLTFAQAATVGVPYTTAALALRRAMTNPGDVVLVIGASGAVGSAVCQLARYSGNKVLSAARRRTADIDLTQDPSMRTAKCLTGGRGPNVIVDTTGSPDNMRAAIECLAEGGRLSYIAAPRQGSRDVTFDMAHAYRHEIIIIGCNSLRMTQSLAAGELDGMRDGFESGALHVHSDGDLEKISIGDAVAVYRDGNHGSKRKYVIAF